jgi:hypothetical protein
MENCIKLSGTIVFDPDDVTSKQKRQAEWKKVAMVMFEPDLDPNEKGIADYYAWFLKTELGLYLHKPLRGAHVTFINDHAGRDMKYPERWEEVKKKWDGKKMEVTLLVDPLVGVDNRRGNYIDWWLTVPYEAREELHAIRRELGLQDRPYFGLHMTIGTAVDSYPRTERGVNAQRAKRMNVEQSEYLINLYANRKRNEDKHK